MEQKSAENLMTRRQALKLAGGAAAAFTIMPAASARAYAANDKINMGMIGLAGIGNIDLGFFSGNPVKMFGPPNFTAADAANENIVALCDVDDTWTSFRGLGFPKAKRYRDFRKMIETEKLDAVSVAVPDHMHAYISVWAMKHGLHVYCQKPLCQTVHEARIMAKVAAETKVMTQMGTQTTSDPHTMRMVELVQSGVLGEITEIHSASDRPIWPQGYDRPAGQDPVPSNFDWDLWQGVAHERPFMSLYPSDSAVYNPIPERKHQSDFIAGGLDPLPPVGVVYHPFVWRGWTEYGTGVIGDGLGHSWNGIYWALDPGPPSSAEVVESTGMSADKQQFPASSAVMWEWKRSGGRPSLKVFHYDGGKQVPKEVAGPKGRGGVWIGTKGSYPQGAGPFQGQKSDPYPVPPQKDWGRVEVHKDFCTAIRTGKLPGCHFGYAGPYSEGYLLGNIALKMGQKIEWDSEAFKITNSKEANQHLSREYRKGWDMKEIAGSMAFNC